MIQFYLSFVEDSDNNDDFMRIYNKYNKMMFKIIRSHIKDIHYAENALQTAFIGVAKNIDTIIQLDEQHLEIYLCTTARNSALSVIRQESQYIKNTVSLDEQYEDIKSNDSPDEMIIKNDLLNRLTEYIKQMEPEYRDVLTYHFLYNMTLKKCAELLQIPLSTVKTRLYKARKMLITKFKDLNDG
ncbi:MAG: sigma-70 family RNA polymerase sigma factor [Clostridia bacterium]|nr:sigma-70 family RNA polymerase sigma factor [Clostridia bacterium]